MHHQSAMPEVIENSGRQSTFTQNAWDKLARRDRLARLGKPKLLSFRNNRERPSGAGWSVAAS